MALPLAKLRLYLSLIPLLRARKSITFKEIGDHLGISAHAAAKEIPEALMLCGVPPYMPHDYIACFTEKDRVRVKFADHFRRPARLTLAEAAAVLLALRALPPARGAPLAPAAAGLMRKLESALGSGDVKRLARRIGARRAGGALGKRMQLLQEGLETRRAVKIEYYTQRRRALSERTVRPYALLDSLGQFYLVGRDSVRGKELSFRVDRIRSVELTDERFEKPRGFSAQRYRRGDLYRPGPGDLSVKVRYAAAAARQVRELCPPAELAIRPQGSVERTMRTDQMRWVVDQVLQQGDDAEIHAPKAARESAAQVLDAWHAFYEAHTK